MSWIRCLFCFATATNVFGLCGGRTCQLADLHDRNERRWDDV